MAQAAKAEAAAERAEAAAAVAGEAADAAKASAAAVAAAAKTSAGAVKAAAEAAGQAAAAAAAAPPATAAAGAGTEPYTGAQLLRLIDAGISNVCTSAPNEGSGAFLDALMASRQTLEQKVLDEAAEKALAKKFTGAYVWMPVGDGSLDGSRDKAPNYRLTGTKIKAPPRVQDFSFKPFEVKSERSFSAGSKWVEADVAAGGGPVTIQGGISASRSHSSYDFVASATLTTSSYRLKHKPETQVDETLITKLKKALPSHQRVSYELGIVSQVWLGGQSVKRCEKADQATEIAASLGVNSAFGGASAGAGVSRSSGSEKSEMETTNNVVVGEDGIARLCGPPVVLSLTVVPCMKKGSSRAERVTASLVAGDAEVDWMANDDKTRCILQNLDTEQYYAGKGEWTASESEASNELFIQRHRLYDPDLSRGQSLGWRTSGKLGLPWSNASGYTVIIKSQDHDAGTAKVALLSYGIGHGHEKPTQLLLRRRRRR